jgi:hypothetical protein
VKLKINSPRTILRCVVVGQPDLTAQQWDAEVKKMIGVYGAPINAADAQIIAEYLDKNYGAEDGHSKTDARRP